MIDIYAENNKCPICNSEDFLNDEHNDRECRNGCFRIFESRAKKPLVVHIFYGKSDYDFFVVNQSGKISKSEEQRLLDYILYWRENERYLAKILSN